MSSSAQLYRTCGGRIRVYSKESDGTSFLSPGNLILVLLFPHKLGIPSIPNDRKSKCECTSLYVCSRAFMDHGIIGTDSCHSTTVSNYDGPIILQFDASTRVETSMPETDCLDTIKERLQEMLCWNELCHEFFITKNDVDNQDKRYIEKISLFSPSSLMYSVLQKSRPISLGDIKGVVFSLSSVTRKDEYSSLGPTATIIPVPLLSISLEQIHGQKLDTTIVNKGCSQSDGNVLLKQCVKRLMVGRIITFPQFENQTDSDCFPFGTCNVTVRVPKLSSGYEFLVYKVNDLLPLLQRSRGSYSSNCVPKIFIVLPSTRITLMDSIVTEKVREPCQSSFSEPVTNPSTEELILRAIHGVRYCSLLSSMSFHDGLYALDVPRAYLLSGPPGVGKTFAVRMAVEAANAQQDHAKETRLISLRGSEILSVGANEADAAAELKKKFKGALEFMSKKPENVVVIFLDECDALLSSEVVGATLASLLDTMYSFPSLKWRQSPLNQKFLLGWKRMVVIAATNRIDAIPSFLRRPGRFDRELCIGPPGHEQRFKILKSLLNTVEKSSTSEAITEQDLHVIAELCVGYVAADLSSLVRKAELLSMKDGQPHVTFNYLKEAMRDVGASSLRDSAISSPPATRWDDIAGDAGGAKTGLRHAIEWPITKKNEFEKMGLTPPRGILLHGPPGCAKTTLARAAAGATGVAFLSLSPADVYASSYVGESEAIVRRAFALARSASPCILFFDEIDSIVAASSSNQSGMERGNNAEARVLSTFLNEMDGVDGSISDGVLVLGATNRPSLLDSALLRPGRFDKVIYVPNPDIDGRKTILDSQYQAWLKNGAAEFIDTSQLSSDSITGMMTGAEIVGACREAAMIAIRESLDAGNQNVPKITHRHLHKAIAAVKPLLSNPQVLSEYTRFENEYSNR